MRWTQWPTSAVGSGMCCECNPLLIGFHVVAAVVGAKRARGRDRDEHPVRVARILHDRVEAQPAGARRPMRSRAVLPQAGHLVPARPAVGGAEQCRVLDAGVHDVGIGQRWLEMPDALELPWMRRPVVPLVRARHALVDELVSHRLPRLPPVVRALNHLPEPAGGLRDVDPVGIRRRSLQVIDLPPAEMRSRHIPVLSAAVGRENERSLLGTDEDSYAAHMKTIPKAGARGARGAEGAVRDAAVLGEWP